MKLKDFVQQKVARGESQSEIARKAGVSQATIHKILNTETAQTLETLYKFSNAFNIPMSEFIAAEGTAPYGSPQQSLSAEEKQMLKAFRALPEDRRARLIEDTNLLLIALQGSEKSGREDAGSPQRKSLQK